MLRCPGTLPHSTVRMPQRGLCEMGAPRRTNTAAQDTNTTESSERQYVIDRIAPIGDIQCAAAQILEPVGAKRTSPPTS